MAFESPKTDYLLKVEHLCKFFPVFGKGIFQRQAGAVKAVTDVSFAVKPAETLGLVGESGSGKTTTVRAILRAMKPSSGNVWFKSIAGLVNLAELSASALKPLRQEMQMIFQDPFSSLNPRMTVGQIVGEPLQVHRLAGKKERKERVAEILEKVGLKTAHMVRYPHAFSGGQRQRIGIARALIMNPSLVIADEAVSALDVSVQAQIINLLADLQAEFKMAYVFVAHDLSVVQYICDRVAVMYAGRIVELADKSSLFRSPKHPYTVALMSAVPSPDPDVQMNFGVPGEAADPANLPVGCAFHPRCPHAQTECHQVTPPLVEISPGWQVACHLLKEGAPDAVIT